eukprot:16445660-Heterocapsa_arctica.AAC.1
MKADFAFQWALLCSGATAACSSKEVASLVTLAAFVEGSDPVPARGRLAGGLAFGLLGPISGQGHCSVLQATA